jgi:uncharacterized membrane protein YcaP (DUF421 family)
VNYRFGGLEDMTKFFLLDLILFLIFGGVAIILQYHFGNRLSKKVEIVYGCISAGIIAVTSIVFAIMSIPLSEVHAICYRSPHNPLKKSIFFKS